MNKENPEERERKLEKKRKYEKEYYKENREKLLARKRKYHKEHPERNKEKCKKHYLANKQYFVEKNRKRREKGYKWIKNYKSKLKCIKCGENDFTCLDFHHTDSTEKTEAISVMINNGCGEKRILKEIKKCVILCANCHRKLHWEKTHKKFD